MARLNYKELLELYMAHVEGNAGETFVERREGADWTDKEWVALTEIRNQIERWNFEDEQKQAATVTYPVAAPAPS